jgi:hypothetical protein
MLTMLVLPTSDVVMVDDSDGGKSVLSYLRSDEVPFVDEAAAKPRTRPSPPR